MKLESVGLDRIHIEDKFWTKYINLVKQVMIPYQWEAMNDRIPDAEPSHCLKNFEIAAGLYEGEFYGAVFQDTDIAKWLEAVGWNTAELYGDYPVELKPVPLRAVPYACWNNALLMS